MMPCSRLSRRSRAAWCAGAGVLALLAFGASRAQPTGGNVMTDVTLTGNAVCTTVRVSFNLPVRYLNHFPHGQGSELRISLQPLAAAPSERLNLLGREAYSPADDATPLTSVTYEGDNIGAPALSLQFGRRLYFDAAQGSDFRSIVVFFGDAADGCSVPSP